MKAVSVTFDNAGILALESGRMRSAVVRALRKAGVTALRDMKSEAVKIVRRRKAIRPKYISRALTVERARGSDIASMAWSLRVSGKAVPLTAYPHRQTTKKGVVVEVNRGKRTLLASAFVAEMGSGHKGVFRRRGKLRLPIKELLGSRPVDALLHKGEADAVAARGARTLSATFERLLPLEIEKGKS